MVFLLNASNSSFTCYQGSQHSAIQHTVLILNGNCNTITVILSVIVFQFNFISNGVNFSGLELKWS